MFCVCRRSYVIWSPVIVHRKKKKKLQRRPNRKSREMLFSLSCLEWFANRYEAQVHSTLFFPVVLWFLRLSSLFTEFWKRKQARCAMRWGMSGFEEQEQTRPQYKGIRCDEVPATAAYVTRMYVAQNNPRLLMCLSRVAPAYSGLSTHSISGGHSKWDQTLFINNRRIYSFVCTIGPIYYGPP